MKKKLLRLIAAVFMLAFLNMAHAQVSLPYSEGFENGLNGWTLTDCQSDTGLTNSNNFVHSGDSAFTFHWTISPPQYLISPEFTGTNNHELNVSFYYKSGSTGSFSETFQVGYSTNSNDISAFTFGEEIMAIPGNDWEIYTEAFPSGTKYVAIKCTSNDALYLCIDDFVFTKGDELVEAELTVHDSSSTSNFVPVYGTWCDAYLKCEMVYPATELNAMAGGKINGLTYYLSYHAAAVWDGTFQVFMYEVEDATISDFYGNNGTVLYEGQLDGTGETMTINFDTPYTYNGGNLLVGIYQIVPGDWKTAYFYGESINGASVQGQSTTGLDYIIANQRNFLPKTTFSYLPYTPILTTLPDTLDLGYRPAGAWMRPYQFTLTNPNTELTINSLQLQGTNSDALSIDLGDLTLPFSLGENDSVTLGVNWGDQPASVNGTLNVAFSNENGSFSADFSIMAEVYNPAEGDVWELAKEVNSLPFTETLSTSTNHEHLKYCAEEYSGGVGNGGGTVYWGIRFPAADLAAYAGQTLTKVGIFMDVDGDYGWTYSGNYTVNVYQGGADAPGPLVSTVTEYLFGDMAWHDVTLTAPVVIDASQDLWLTFYTSDIAYPMSGCDYVGNPNSDFLSLDGVNWDHSTDYGLDYTWMIRGVVEDPGLHNNYVLPDPNIPDGNDVVYKLEFEQDVLLNAAITEGDNGKVFLYEQDFQGVGGPDETNGLCFPSNNLLNSASTFVASASVPYYLVASSTSDDFTVSMNTEPLPCPDTATLLTPSNDATNVSEVNTELRWKFGDYTTQYCLLFGTDPNDMDTLVPWTRELNVQHLFNESLNPCTTYYWQVGTRNDGCPDGVFSEVWSFTTVIRLYTITATSNPAEGGSITGADSYCYGSTCTLVATPNTGYHFVNWTVNDTEVSTSETLTFTVTQDTTIVANFDPIQLQVFADYYPNPADSLGEIVRVHWEEMIVDPHPFSEGFESGDFSKFNWQLDESYPWTITTNDPYEGSYCMKSGGSGVANMESIMTVTVDIPADGQMSFFCKISCESHWDYGYFYIDDAQMGQYTGYRSWEEKKFYITQGLHTFKWRYTKDNIGDYNDDCFYVDNITFYKSSEPIQPGWHTYCESDFNNAVGSNLTATPSWAYEYPISFLKSNYAGWNITKVSLFSDNMYNAVGGNYTCNIYVGGAEPASGTIVSTITVDVPSGQNDWVDWDLTTPVNVTGNEPIWIVWTANTTVGSWPAGCCGDLNNLGTWWNGGNGWEHLSYGTWTMRQYFDNGAGKGFYSHANESTRDLPNYRVYRALCNESDPTLLTDTVTVQEYLDNDWVSLDHGFYKYGVSIEDGPIYWSDSIKNIAVYYNINASVNPTEGGSVSGTGPQERHTTCSLVATNNTGYHFTNWTLNDSVVSTNNTLEVYVTQDSTFVAHFELNSYEIEASADPTTGGEITGTGTYHHFDDCTLIATPLTGYHFVNWTVNDTEVSTSDTLTFTVTQDSTFVAHFELNSYEIEASADPTAGGEITGTGTYHHFDDCTLIATPLTGYHFVNWTVNDVEVSTTETLSFTVTQDSTFVAHFNLNSYDIEASADPTSGGEITGAGTYNHFESCTLTATPKDHYVFLNWTEDDIVVSNEPVLTFEVLGARSLVANFMLKTYTVTVGSVPFEGGTVTGGNVYAEGETANLNAIPNDGFVFRCWNRHGISVSEDASYSFTVTEDVTLLAHFDIIWKNVDVTIVPPQAGTVEGGGRYMEGATATLQAYENQGYAFNSWVIDGITYDDNPINIEVNNDIEIVANFDILGYVVTVGADPDEGGSVSGGGEFDYGQTATVNAEANEGYTFVNWTINGEQVSTEMEYSFTVTETVNLMAHFTLNNYLVTVNADPAEGGTVMGSSGYDYGQTATVNANANTGYTFVNWTLNGQQVSTENEYSFTVTESVTLVAHFSINSYEVIVNAEPSEGGNVSGDGEYEYGQTATVNANANTGYTFVNWTLNGEQVSTETEYSFTVTETVELVAHFTLNNYTVTVNADPAEGGVVSGTGGFDYGQTATVNANANTGYTFVNWTLNGEQVSTETEYSFTVTETVELVAHFTLNNYTVTVNADPAEGGVVSGTGGFDYGQTATVNANANTGYTFVNWTLNGEQVSTENEYSFTVTESVTLVAHFSINSYEITVNAEPAEGGDVSGDGEYDYGETVTVNANANTGYTFVNWTLDGQQVSTETEYSFTVTETVELVAHFTLNNYTVTVNADPAEGGVVSGTGGFDYGQTATVNANANTGYTFVNWTLNGEQVSTENEYSFTVTESVTLVAHFSINSYEVTVNAEPAEGGTVEGTGTYLHGQTATLNAEANYGYHFVSWTLDGTVVSTESEYSFTVTESVTLVAHFSNNSYEVTVNAEPAEGGDVSGDGEYDYGETATVNANPNTGYTFVNWTLNGEQISTETEYSFTVTETVELVAHFTLNNYTVNVNADPTEGGVVSGTGGFDYGQTATVSAVANFGYTFVNWTLNGEQVSTEPEYSFTVTESVTLVAHFSINSYVVTVNAEPAEGGTVEGTGTYLHGQTATLNAEANYGYHFVSWTLDGTVVTTESEYSFTVLSEALYVANFEVTMYDIIATAKPEIGGSTEGSGSYAEGTTVNLTAIPAEHYYFVNWTEDDVEVSTEAEYIFEATANKTLVAHFEPITFEVTVGITPASGGIVEGSGVYMEGSTATLTAIPAEGYEFINWTKNGIEIETALTYSFEVTANVNIMAHFQLIPGIEYYLVDAIANPAEGGTIEGFGEYAEGSIATLTATATEGYAFVSWTVEGETITDNPYSFNVIANVSVVANFELLQVEYNIYVKEVEHAEIMAPTTSIAGELISIDMLLDPMYGLVSLYYYTDDPSNTVAIDLQTMAFVMPQSDVTISATLVELTGIGDVNLDGNVNILDVLTTVDYILGENPQPFELGQADINGDGFIDISDVMAINALILGLRTECDDVTAVYEVVDGALIIESEIALAGYQFSLSAEPVSIHMPGFCSMGRWINGEYLLLLFNLNGEKEAGLYSVLDLGEASVNDVVMATREGCKVRSIEGTVSVASFDENSYSVYPVPAHTQVTVAGPGITTIEVYNMMGQKVMTVNEINGDTTVVNVSTLAKGSYLFRINTVHGVTTKTVVVTP